MHPDIVSIVAGGWSFRDVDQSRLPGFIIGVNDAGVRLPLVHAVVSMDRLWTENRWQQLERLRRTTFLRLACLKNIQERPWWLTLYDCDHESTEMQPFPPKLNGTNSGMVALNLAYVLKPKRILLFGFDCNLGPKGEKYYYPPYPWAKQSGGTAGYRKWAAEYAGPAEQFRAAGIEVLNANPKSSITAFPKVNPEKVLL